MPRVVKRLASHVIKSGPSKAPLEADATRPSRNSSLVAEITYLTWTADNVLRH